MFTLDGRKAFGSASAVIRLILAAFIDGEPRTGKHKFAVDVVSVGLTLGLLYWGGFFG